MKLVLLLRGLAATLVLASLAACGGGGDSDSSSALGAQASPSNTPQTPTLSCAP